MTHEEANLQTKLTLAASLKKRMAEKHLGRITIAEIITDCNVNRKTFYYHFTDIYALMKWMLEQETIEVLKSFDLLVEYEEAICFVIEYVQKNEYILHCAYDYMGRAELEQFFHNAFLPLIQNVIRDCEKKNQLNVSDEFQSFISCFYTKAVVGMLIGGFMNKCLPEQKTLVRNMTVLIDSLPDILRRAVRP